AAADDRETGKRGAASNRRCRVESPVQRPTSCCCCWLQMFTFVDNLPARRSPGRSHAPHRIFFGLAPVCEVTLASILSGSDDSLMVRNTIYPARSSSQQSSAPDPLGCR